MKEHETSLVSDNMVKSSQKGGGGGGVVSRAAKCETLKDNVVVNGTSEDSEEPYQPQQILNSRYLCLYSHQPAPYTQNHEGFTLS